MVNKTILVVMLVVAVFTKLFSQQLISGDVINQKKESLPFVSVYYLGKDIGTYVNERGSFSIRRIPADTLVFSMIGYKTLHLSANDIKEKQEIILISEATDLMEIQVVGKTGKNIEKRMELLGTLDLSVDMYNKRPKGNQQAVWIESPNKTNLFVKSVIIRLPSNFYTPKEDQNRCGNIRIHLYTQNQYTKKPGESLLKKDMIVTLCARGRKKRIAVDLTEQFIALPSEGLFVGIELLGETNKKGEYILSSGNLWPIFLTHKRSPDFKAYQNWAKIFDKEWGIEEDNILIIGLETITYSP